MKMLEAHYMEGVLTMANFSIHTIADDGDDVETYRFGTMVAADVVVGDADDVQSLLVVDSMLGWQKFFIRAGLHLYNDQCTMVQCYDVHLFVPLAVVAVQNDIPLVFQVACGHLLASNS